VSIVSPFVDRGQVPCDEVKPAEVRLQQELIDGFHIFTSSKLVANDAAG
jgi:hypothetical protein